MDLDDQVEIVRVVKSLMVLGNRYKRLADDLFTWEGPRPGPAWHVHGWLGVQRVIAVGDGLTRVVTLLKRRWLDTEAPPDSPKTRHDRPPDDLGGLYDALIVAASLWCWLDAALGLQRYAEPFHDGPATRTVQRWLRKALPNAMRAQQRIREVLIEKCEPRPFEQLVPGGIPPPGSRLRRGWRDPDSVWTLCQGLTMLFRGASALVLHPPALLAEARGRGSHPQATNLF